MGREARMAKRIGLWLFIAAMAGLAAFNLYAVIRGLVTGEITTLHKSPGPPVHYAAAPGTFIVNVVLRALIALICAGWGAILAWDEWRGPHRS
jgi:hypothetical protein